MADNTEAVILVVDDSKTVRQGTVRILEEAGFAVREAGSGAEALRAAAERPDLIVLDINMPDISGFEVCRILKANSSTRHIPVLHLSATYLSLRDKIAGLEGGADGYLTQPVDQSELIVTIKSLLRMKRAEDALRESESRYRDLVENSTDLICTHDLDGNILSANIAAVNALEYPAETLLRMNLREIIFPEMRDRLTVYLNKMRQHGAVRGLMHVMSRSGEQKVWEYNNTLRIEGVPFPIVRGMARDVTEQKQAKAKLSQSEAEFRRLSMEFHGLLDAIPDSLTLQDRDLKILWANNGAANRYGKQQDELVGRYCYNLWHNETVACEPCPVLKSFVTGNPENHVITTPDCRVWDLRSIPLKNEKGEIISVIELGRDITEHRRLEEQLRHSQKIEGVGQLAGGIAHDFNNILNAVVGFAGLLQMKMDKSDPMSHFVDGIMAAGQRGAALTHQILAFSRKQVLDMKPLNLNEVIKSLEKMLQRLVREDISIVMNLFKKDLVVLADPSQIDQVLINLVTNARDAMLEGGRLGISTEPFVMNKIFIETHGYGSLGEYALLSVSDTGQGMDAETSLRIFEPFFTTKEAGKGTGLGLAVVHGIVKQHNGYIDAYSLVGKGTVFKIYLPLVEHPAEETEEAAEELIKGGAETILIAEDDASLRKLFETVLENYGYKVIVAVDGEDAVLKFSGSRDLIDLVILDGIMPKKNGKEAYVEIRRLCPDMKAIFISGYAEDIFSRKGIPDKEAVFIQKPVTPSKLLLKVREVLDG